MATLFSFLGHKDHCTDLCSFGLICMFLLLSLWVPHFFYEHLLIPGYNGNILGYTLFFFIAVQRSFQKFRNILNDDEFPYFRRSHFRVYSKLLYIFYKSKLTVWDFFSFIFARHLIFCCKKIQKWIKHNCSSLRKEFKNEINYLLGRFGIWGLINP